jgi:hypothetical protein
MAQRLYTRLTPTRRLLGGFASLWLGPDHLLQVHSTGYTESYSRIHLREIKGIFVTGSERRQNIGLVWALIGLVVLFIVMLSSKSVLASVITAAILIVPLIWNHLLGLGCRFYIVTGVQTAPIEAVARWPRARKLLARIQPVIEAAQADLGPVAPPPPVEPAATPPLPLSEPAVD